MGKPQGIVKYKGAWSYSKLRDFETCKAQFRHRHIEKTKEPESQALIHGSAVHDAIERWFKGWYKPAEKKKLEEALGELSDDFKKLKAMKPTTEMMWAHSPDWSAMEDPFDRSAWVRAKTDAHMLLDESAYVFDWKTGKPKEMYPDQLRFYGVLALLRFPGADEVTLELWYVDHGKIVSGLMKREELPSAQKEFKHRATRLYNEARWAEEPGMHCRWCPFRKSAGGPCSF